MSHPNFHWHWYREDVIVITIKGHWIVQDFERTLLPHLNESLRDIDHPYNVIFELQNGIGSIIMNLIRSSRAGNMSRAERIALGSGLPAPDPQKGLIVHHGLFMRWLLRRIIQIEDSGDDAFTICKSMDEAVALIETNSD